MLQSNKSKKKGDQVAKIPDMMRTGFSLRTSDYQWLSEQERLISSVAGIDVGVSFVVRIMIRYFIANQLDLRNYQDILGTEKFSRQ